MCPVRRGDVLAAWSGIRPLVTDPNSKDTQSICRNHIVSVSDSGLVTIAGQRSCCVRGLCMCVCVPTEVCFSALLRYSVGY